MERLVKDAEKIKKSFKATRDENGKLTLSFSDVVDAIHIVQEEMGITGTTAEEASETIAGSVSSMKAAWSDLVTELGKGNGDIKGAMEKLVKTIVGDENGKGGVLANLLPTVDAIFEGITELVDELVPRLVESLPGFIEKYLPMLVNSAMHLVETIISAIGNNSGRLAKSLGSAISSIILHAAQNTPALIGSVLDLILKLISEIGNNLGTIIPSLITSIINVITEIAKRSSEFTDAAFAIINGIVDAITSPEATVQMVAAGLNLIIALTAGMITAIPDLILNFSKVIETVVNNFKNVDAEGLGANFASSIGSGITGAWDKVRTAWNNLWGLTKKLFKFYVGDTITWGKDLIDNFISGINSRLEKLRSTVTRVAQTVRNLIGFSEPKEGPLSNFHTYAPDMMDLFAKGIRDNENVITDQIEKSFNFGDKIVSVGSFVNAGGNGWNGSGVSIHSVDPADSFGSFGGTTFGDVIINIDGGNYSSEQSLAEAIAIEIQNMTDRRSSVYA